MGLLTLLGKSDNLFNKAFLQEMGKQGILVKLTSVIKENSQQYNQTFLRQVINCCIQLANQPDMRQLLVKHKVVESVLDTLRQMQLDKPTQKHHTLLLSLVF